ncbi:hypothetical protein WKI71_43705 [Streptomyces sp. MS1.AVA.1]|uniref:Uncharacterized protein n=1 Tax=Streptomyces machairae TaxID=3134109 RepID=A0ABU8UV22_9ACTN
MINAVVPQIVSDLVRRDALASEHDPYPIRDIDPLNVDEEDCPRSDAEGQQCLPKMELGDRTGTGGRGVDAEEALIDLAGRVTFFIEGGDPAAVLDQAALATALDLSRDRENVLAQSEGCGDEQIESVGFLYVKAMFLRCHTAAGHRPPNLLRLSHFFTAFLLAAVESGNVPQRWQSLVSAVVPNIERDARAREGLGLMERGLQDDDDTTLDDGIALVRASLTGDTAPSRSTTRRGTDCRSGCGGASTEAPISRILRRPFGLGRRRSPASRARAARSARKQWL